jgi:hypothetical protein
MLRVCSAAQGSQQAAVRVKGARGSRGTRRGDRAGFGVRRTNETSCAVAPEATLHATDEDLLRCGVCEHTQTVLGGALTRGKPACIGGGEWSAICQRSVREPLEKTAEKP